VLDVGDQGIKAWAPVQNSPASAAPTQGRHPAVFDPSLFERQCSSSGEATGSSVGTDPELVPTERPNGSKVIRDAGQIASKFSTGWLRSSTVRVAGFAAAQGLPAIEDLGRFSPQSACSALVRLTPRVVRGLDRASLPPTPASPSGEAPPVRKAPGRCAPAPLPCSGVSAPALPGPGRPHPRGRASTGPANLSG
jgi:hypothetical protein